MQPMSKTKIWVEAMRLRTLPVGVSAVLAGTGMAALHGVIRPLPAVICLLFALLAQIASNFANEYFDYRAGIDAPGRQGPRRGVTEGDITPAAMRRATFLTLGAACLVGLTLVWWGGWWLIAAGAVIAAGALAYSAGPYPLSRNALGESAVLLFFGLVPVCLTCYIQTGRFTLDSLLMGLATGMLAANILVVNNYRDRHEDAAAGKRTEVTMWGRRYALADYALHALLAVAATLLLWTRAGGWALLFPALYLVMAGALLRRMATHEGAALNPVLGLTAMSELFFTLSFMIVAIATASPRIL